ncbi:MAG: HPr family phosphocarrier protein, partial [Clostridia bacterium]|nr:HPr family phosphocarrier protein [Clostridia bacterium]
MLSKEITLVNSVGLHARPATFFIQKANSYRCSVWIENNSRRANAKSLLGVLSLGVRQGDSVTL